MVAEKKGVDASVDADTVGEGGRVRVGVGLKEGFTSFQANCKENYFKRKTKQ